MHGELNDAVSVPQVFEVGARVAFVPANPYLGAWTRVLTEVRGGDVWGVDEDSDESIVCPADRATPGLRVIAPAPRDGQRWTSPTCNFRVGSPAEHEPVATARWLLRHGYSYSGPADAAPETLRASEAAPTVPAPVAPALWTLTAARRLITETIASAKPRRPAAFTAALCALAEHGVPPAKLVAETAVAITALEAALPDHGAVARWQAERAMWQASDRVKATLNGTQRILALSACRIYLQRRGAW